jgi:hypothetical protein
MDLVDSDDLVQLLTRRVTLAFAGLGVLDPDKMATEIKVAIQSPLPTEQIAEMVLEEAARYAGDSGFGHLDVEKPPAPEGKRLCSELHRAGKVLTELQNLCIGARLVGDHHQAV